MTDSYRYTLSTEWSSGGRLLNVIGLNPSTADDFGGTVRRSIAIAQHHGYDGLLVTNLFARRALTPRDLALSADPVGAENDEALLTAANDASTLVCAWGTAGSLHGRDTAVRELLSTLTLWCFGLTRDRHPRHPLYLPADTPLVEFPKPWMAADDPPEWNRYASREEALQREAHFLDGGSLIRDTSLPDLTEQEMIEMGLMPQSTEPTPALDPEGR